MFEWCEEHTRAALLLSVGIASLVAAVDLLTGDRFPLIVCYLPSIFLLCTVVRPAVAYCAAAVCSSAWMIDDVVVLQMHSVSPQGLWIASVHFVFFTVIIGMLFRLRVAHERERLFARTDALTGLSNSKAFRDTAERELARSKRNNGYLAVAFIDCDNFKAVNDTLGHRAGDELLKAMAETMELNIRKMDTAARMGGDEFAVLLPEASLEEAELVISRLRESLLERMQQSNWPVTFSIGVAVYQSLPDSIEDMIHGADLLMYEVKQNSKNAATFRLVA
ncbi:GGDEF domain-containing protein [Aeoliella sp. ICT_H6.2]|uniref:diguanylate cyclase n=1 Tax=Aeoliella straminimaris TaxID=2954799 RepID=A0A9X2F9K0_9BACT|nr:GGDEF domain-containing protein [Aeoliella straminimaris]MCO6044820.1 GGDEF domain-containing protein [Aeoliella straminimaris]